MSLLAQAIQIGQGFLCFLPLVFFSTLAFWKPKPVLFMLVFGVAYITGLYAPDLISGNYETTPMGIVVGFTLILYAIFCAGYSFKLMFSSGE